MATFNHERLRSARLLAGLSLRQLEQALNAKVTYNSINKYENGLMQPDNGTIIRLSEVLQVPPSYFFAEKSIELGEIKFRKYKSLTEKDIRRIEEKTKATVERYLEVENLLNISQAFVNPLAKKQVKDPSRAEEMAEITRMAWGLGTNPISNVIEMLEEHQVKVIEIDASEKFDGLSAFVDDGIPVAVVNDSFTIERKRFTALHELGHLLMNIIPEDDREVESACHRFAGAMLFPASEVKKTLGASRSHIAIGELVAIKEEYGISAQAAMRRALDLGIIASSTYQQFFRKIAGNRKETGLGAYKGVEKSHRLLQLVFRLSSEGVVSVERAAYLAGMSVAAYRALYNNVPMEEDSDLFNVAESAFSDAWGNEEPEYTLDDVKTINPDYAGR